MKQEGEEKRGPSDGPGRKKNMSKMWRDMRRPRSQGDPIVRDREAETLRDVDQKTWSD